MDFRIRQAVTADAGSIAELAIASANAHLREDCTEDGLRHLQASLAADAVLARMQGGEYDYRVAVDDNQVRGFCALRKPAHLFHLFVADEARREGVARALWDNILERLLAERLPVAEITVNASTNAVVVYRRFGFVPRGAIEWRNGVRSQPMYFKLRAFPAA